MSSHIIEFNDVSFSYANGVKALNKISFTIGEGEKVALLGKNGAGKSTLLQLTNGLLLPSEGEINVAGVNLTKKTLRRIREIVGMVFQNPDDQLFMPTVEEDVAFGPLNMKLSEEEVRNRVYMALSTVGCVELAKRSPMQLSGGQKRRVAIATVLSMLPSVMVLDEPTSNLDWAARESVVKMINDFMHTCLIASHDLALIKKVCNRGIILSEGQLLFDAPINEIFNSRKALQLLGISMEGLSEMCICGG